ncbi:hypothetical protein HYT18_00745 [Candidatus Microgenomates bacterium]|nr:hypothetical protein [Candidatus Microgenomates bacterium]
MNQRGQTQVLILAGIVILVAIAGGIFWLGRETLPRQDSSGQAVPESQAPVTTPQPSPTDETANPDSIGANWKTYTNNEFSFVIKHPSVLVMEEKDQSNISLVDKSKDLAAEGASPIYPSIFINIESSSLAVDEFIKSESLIVGEKKLFGQNEFTTAYSEIGGRPHAYFIKKDPTIISITDQLGHFDTEQYQFNQILSTFKFID